MNFWTEIKRRNVARVAAAYVVTAWLIVQASDVLVPALHLPGWMESAVVFVLILGFPLALVFAWAFELTPEGLKRESEVDRSASITHVTGRKLDFAIIGLLGVAVVYFAFDKFVINPQRTADLVATATESAAETARQEVESAANGVEPSSIAVLPFVNMSADPEQEYFSDGLTEELLNLLARIPQLKVASRSSAFQFKGEKIDIVEVANKLNVAHVLEGSVRRSGDELRITAQLIKADDGFHLWSEKYDRPFDNIFAIQDEIAAAVVKALRVKLLSEAPKAEVADPDAYALKLKGRYFYMQWGEDNFERAVDAYKSALEIDPSYARAWADLGVVYFTQIQTGYRPREDASLAVQAVNRALEIDPEHAEGWARLALVRGLMQWDWVRGQDAVEKALALDPDNSIVLGAASNLATATADRDAALGFTDRILAADPLNLIALYNRGYTLVQLGRLDEARAAFKQVLEINPQDWGSNAQVAIVDLLESKPEAALVQLEKEVDPVQQEFARILTLYKLDRDKAVEHHQRFIEDNGDWAYFQIAQLYAWAGESDAAFEWLNRAYEHRDVQMAELLVEVMFRDLHDDPRWDPLVRKMGLPPRE